jgi:septal ring factor EnvC (AmiA/AmiB activator)
MDPREDDDLPSDDSDDNDPIIRELRTEMVRLQAQLDQLAAAARERAAEISDLRARLSALERRIDAVNARWRRERLWTWLAALYGAAVGVVVSLLMRL